MLDWIASRASSAERPFIQYHALLALLYAARNASPTNMNAVRKAYEAANEALQQVSLDSDRRHFLEMIDLEVKSI